MGEIIIRKQKRIRIPEDLPNLTTDDPRQVEKLSLHFCSNIKVKLSDHVWPNLKYIEIIGCRYLEFGMNWSTESQIRQLYIANTDYVDMLEIRGNHPYWDKLTFDQAKYVKFKGEIIGKIGLKEISSRGCPNIELFKEIAFLPYLKRLSFVGCNFLKLGLATLTAPNLTDLYIKKSNYTTFVSMGEIAGQLISFKFEDCAYPKFIEMDLAQIMAKVGNEKSSGGDGLYEEIPLGPFRKVKLKPLKPKPGTTSEVDDLYYDALRSAPSQEKALSSANQFLSNIAEDNVIEMRFCPKCGVQNPMGAKFCGSCGEGFER